MNKMRRLLICSLILNFVFIAFVLLLVFKRDSIMIIFPPSTSMAVHPKYIETNLYLGRKDIYANLPDKESAIVFVGDSIIDFCQWNELLEQPAINRGINGDTVEGLQLRINEVLRHRPQKLFISVGVNDLATGKTVNDVKAEYQKLINTIQTNSPQTQIFIHSLSPVSRVSWQNQLPQNLTDDIIEVNKFLPQMADGKKIVFIDTYSLFADKNKNFNTQYTIDGVHPNGKGYIKWREVLQPYLK